ncbi:alpha-ketoglutarate-dependent dioxygenase AlkB [Novosphingobium sp. BL-8A]|uniref:alpha-ketoglutarate-dependent dioxygenase AlkB n=1 Tax=Novosphingobium sp. BL-8A TaxID=3127639 RepID=UPI003756872D
MSRSNAGVDMVQGQSPRQLDLFGAPPATSEGKPTGLESWEEVVSPAEERELIARIDASALKPFRFQGWLGKRLTCSFGWTYDFDSGRAERGEPIPDWLVPARNLVAGRLGLVPEVLEQALLIRYDPGATIGWHKDRPMFGDVAGLSLGRSAPLRFRRRTEHGFSRFTHEALPRSLYLLSGEVRHCWEHSIAELDGPRWSITFRSLASGSRSAERT